MRIRQTVDKPPFTFVGVNHLMEIKQPEKLPANFSKLAVGAPSTTTSYAMIRGNRTTSRQIMSIKEDIMQIREVLSRLQETASSKEEGDFMYEQKEIIEKIDQVKDKVSGLETSIALIEERTRELDSIKQSLSELNDKISAEAASKDLVHKDIEHFHTKIEKTIGDKFLIFEKENNAKRKEDRRFYIMAAIGLAAVVVALLGFVL